MNHHHHAPGQHPIAGLHAAIHGHIHRHVCILESDGYDQAAVEKQNEELIKDNAKAQAEIQRLRDLLTGHDIPWTTSSKGSSNKVVRRPKRAPTSTLESTRTLRARTGSVVTRSSTAADKQPCLPIEIVLRILRYAVTSPVPIIDPFFKLRKGNCTREEYISRKYISINFLATSKALRVEGIRLLIKCNTFIFTQVGALQNFQKIPSELRSTIENLTLRVVGQYYDEVARKLDLSGAENYHPKVEKLIMPILARPPGLYHDEGVQSYCWLQLSDFLKAMMFHPPATGSSSSSTREYESLIPSLKALRLDLVNFCDHLPFPGPRYASVIRWYVGNIADEVMLTGAPDLGVDNSEESMLRHMVRNEGLFGASYPVFVSNANGNALRTLSDTNFQLEVIRANPSLNPKPATASTLQHPEGGNPPKSKYRAGKTIWKWATPNAKTPKKWIEFDRKSGMMVNFLPDFEIDSEFEFEEDEDDSDILDGLSDSSIYL